MFNNQLAQLDAPKVAGLLALGSIALLIAMRRNFASVRIG